MSKEQQKNERDFKGIWIPKEIWLNPNLTPFEKLLIVEIDSLDNDDKKGCFASNKYFGEFFGLSEGRIANMISDLKKREFLFQVFFDGRNRGLRVHKNVKAGLTKQGVCVHENVNPEYTKRGNLVARKREHNNTVNNPSNNTEGEREQKNASLTPAPPPTKKTSTVEEEKNETNNLPAAAGGAAAPAKCETAFDAGLLISNWVGENEETVKSWYSVVKRKFSMEDVTQVVIKFCGNYANNADTGKRMRFLADPVLFFRNQCSGWLIDQNQYDSKQAAKAAQPKQGFQQQPATAYTTPPPPAPTKAYYD